MDMAGKKVKVYWDIDVPAMVKDLGKPQADSLFSKMKGNSFSGRGMQKGQVAQRRTTPDNRAHVKGSALVTIGEGAQRPDIPSQLMRYMTTEVNNLGPLAEAIEESELAHKEALDEAERDIEQAIKDYKGED
jgi:hypothetical protein